MNFGLAQTMEPQGPTTLVVKGVVGLFEEEEEGIGIASGIVKVKGEDPTTPGCRREDRIISEEVRRWF